MADDEIPAEDATEVVDRPLLNLDELATVAERRYERAKANPDRRGDPDLAYMGHVLGVLDANEQALSNALYAAAEVWLAKSEATGIGDTAKKHLLASKVLDGDFDK